MGTGWGDALLSLSKSVPGVATAFDDEKKRKEEEARRAKALADLARWKRDMGEVDNYNNTNASMEQIDISPIVPTDPMGASSPLPADQYTNLYNNNTRLGNLAKKSRLESAVDYGVVEGGAFDLGVKAVVDATNKTEATTNGQTARTDWQMKKKMWDANPESMKNFLEQIDTLEKNGVFTPDAANYWRSAARLDPVSAKIKVDDYVAKPDIAGLTVTAQTGPKVDQKRALIQPSAETAAAVEGAKTPKLIERAGPVAAAAVEGRAEGETASNVDNIAIPGLKPITGVKITNDSVQRIKKAMPDMQSISTSINEIISKYDKMGSEIIGDDAADYASKIRNLQMLAKSESLYNLGVITGPDLMLLESVLPDPSSIKEGLKKQVVGDISVRLKNFRDSFNNRKLTTLNSNGFDEVRIINGKEFKRVPGGWEEL